MDWLSEDEAWERAKGLLGTVPPEIQTYLYLLERRLRLLQSAGVASERLDREWDRLLSDFPEDIPLHLLRYDSLRDAARRSDAAAVLRKIRPVEPENPFLNARLVEVFARERNRNEAIAALHRVFFAPTEKSQWPVGFAWQTALGARFANEAFDSVDEALQGGKRPTPHALRVWASHALGREQRDSGRGEPPWRAWLPGSGARKVLRILRGEESAAWMDGRYRMHLLTALCDHGYAGLVVRYWRRNRAQVESDIDCWAQSVRALAVCGRKREARELMAVWRERQGVGLWVVASFAGCWNGLLPRDRRDLRGWCVEAVRALPHDPCARYLAHLGAEASALLGDTDGLLESWRQHIRYFDGKLAENEWFDHSRRHLLEDIPFLVRSIEGGRRLLYQRTLWRLRSRYAWRALRASMVGRVVENVPFMVWWLLVLGISAILANL
jgi:hypothetical protein